jgi:hypothetical protein
VMEETESKHLKGASNAYQTLDAWRESGRCLARESVIDEVLGPWAKRGGKIKRRDVESVSKSDRIDDVCVKIVSNRLYMDHKRIPGGRYGLEEPPNTTPLLRWYAECLAHTLMAVLKEFQVPDLEFCGGNETPRILKGKQVRLGCRVWGLGLWFRRKRDTSHTRRRASLFYLPPKRWTGHCKPCIIQNTQTLEFDI